MIKQIILGDKKIHMKFHGLVKHIVFECNNCHKKFMKMESYYRKQMKKRTNACCFCSPFCRSKFLSQFTKVNKKNGFIPNFFRNIFS